MSAPPRTGRRGRRVGRNGICPVGGSWALPLPTCPMVSHERPCGLETSVRASRLWQIKPPAVPRIIPPMLPKPALIGTERPNVKGAGRMPGRSATDGGKNKGGVSRVSWLP